MIQSEYNEYKISFREKSSFYKTYKLQGTGDRDMWQIMLERMLSLVGENGIISVLYHHKRSPILAQSMYVKQFLIWNIRRYMSLRTAKRSSP